MPKKNTKSVSRNARKVNQKVTKPLSEKEEEIIEYIGKSFEINKQESIKRLDLAEILQRSPALVNKLLNKLEEKGLIDHKKYGEIKLTEKGLKTANELIRKHRLSEALFVNILGLEASKAHDFACKFEHIIDEKVANRIEKVLNYPEFCPHGHPINATHIKAGVSQSLPLTSFSADELVRISQIVNEESDFLTKLSHRGIEVGVIAKVIEKSPIDKTLLIEVNGKIIPLGEETAKKLLGVSAKVGELKK